MDIDNLLSKMTVEEKIGQLLQCGTSIYKDEEEIKWDMVRTGRIGAFLYIKDAKVANELQRCAVEESRLGIPLIFGDDIIHGFFTNFPVPAAEACSWEPELARRTAEISARETRANGVQWTFAPMVDIARDARWGRNLEGAGEDPYLASHFAAARVKGFQGDDISKPDRVAACAKHFAGYGACMGGRDYNSVEMSNSTFYDAVLPPFKAAIDSDVATVMSAFHDLNGVPCTGNKWLLTDVLRDELGFEGMLVSDAGAVEQLQVHGFTENERDTAKIAMNAGIDMEMASFTYSNCLKQLIEDGEVPMERLDEAVLKVLELKDKLGLFENPYIDIEKASKVRANEESIAIARECSVKSIVLLKNGNNVLPINKKAKIALIGALAGDETAMNGAWSGRTKTAITIRSALKENGYDFVFAKGYEVLNNNKTSNDIVTEPEWIQEAVDVAKECDVILYICGEGPNMAGEAHNRSNIEMPKAEIEVLKAIKKVNKPIVAYIFSGRPLAIRNVDEMVDSILWSGKLGTEAGNAMMDVIFGDYNPSAKLVWTFPTSDGQSPYYYNHNNTGKPPIDDIWYSSKYIDAPIGVQYPFGYGLSYTSFEYSKLELSDIVIGVDDTLTVSVNVTNTGSRRGEEVVQLYIHDKVASIVRPVKELKGYKKISLEVGETKKVVMELPARTLGFHNQKLEYVVEPGKFDIYVGTNSNDCLQAEFEIR